MGMLISKKRLAAKKALGTSIPDLKKDMESGDESLDLTPPESEWEIEPGDEILEVAPSEGETVPADVASEPAPVVTKSHKKK